VRREREATVSDGRLAIFDAFCARVEPVRELDEASLLVVDTERPLTETLQALDDRLRTWPRGLNG
jgi:hypothetical protein